MYLTRSIEEEFKRKLIPNKVLLLIGPRRVGKTHFLTTFLKDYPDSYLHLNGEDSATQEAFAQANILRLTNLIGTNSLLVIDEAQNIADIGLKLKLIVDHIPDIKVVATGSSAFDLSNKMGEPLTGRKFQIQLFPFSQKELNHNENRIETASLLEQRLIFGSYPELSQLNNKVDKIDYLNELTSSYLLKDILEFDGVRNASKVYDLLKLIAFQVGSEVSYNELSRSLGINKITVERYLDLLTKVFVLYKVTGFSRNLRKEVTKSSKWYFIDNGVRNAVINNFNGMGLRNDVGILWENYILSERVKHQHQSNMKSYNYFWRTYDQQAIDWVEEREGNLFAFEVKWNKHKKVKTPVAWKNAYPDSKFEVINPDNYYEWVVG